MRDQNDKPTPEEIESDIERTRADFSSTIDAIQTKLAPKNLADQAVDYALNTTPGIFGTNMVNTVRDNPMPVALIGIGIAWLMATSRQTSYAPRMRRQRAMHTSAYYPGAEDGYDGGYGAYEGGYPAGYASHSATHDTDEGMMHRVSSKASEATSQLKDKASQASQRLSGTASEMSDRARQMRTQARGRLHETTEQARARMHDLSQRSQVRYNRAKDQAGQLLDEQPLVVGALGIAVGAVLGAALPVTRKENELMGRTRDDLVGRATETMREQAETVKQSAQRVMQTAKESASQEASQLKDVVANSASQSTSQSSTMRPGGTTL